eukprot:TRINITY_DN11855_c2_g1_i2.p1 TRINITY_DN11855_c2_g1~~TRINITY_DN11855_c2_g1_i2.p1  ORF type:complete len:137 (+),score=14.92 TRINITY_DN11855_c2_g1_i2:111-521(+)
MGFCLKYVLLMCRGRQNLLSIYLFIVMLRLFVDSSSKKVVCLGVFQDHLGSLLSHGGAVPFSKCGLILWRIIPFFMLWSIWKEGNERIFSRKESSWEGSLTAVLLRIAELASVRNECADLKIDNVRHGCGVCLKCL